VFHEVSACIIAFAKGAIVVALMVRQMGFHCITGILYPANAMISRAARAFAMQPHPSV
jgi:hypothetical protein